MDDREKPERRGGGPTWAVTFVLSSGAIVSSLGLMSLLGWLLELPLPAGFGAGTVPMAPSTALLFIADGVALGLLGRPLRGRRATVVVRSVTGLVAVVALALFVLSSIGIHSPVEHLGMRITGEVRGTPLGHISPVTAAWLLLASLSALILLPTSSASSLRRLAAFGLAGVLLGTSIVFFLAYLYGRPLLYGTRFIPPAASTTLGLAVLSAGLLVAAGRRGEPPVELHTGIRASGWLLLVFILLAAGLVAAGQYYNRNYQEHYRVKVESQLAAIADLKVSELTQWRRERLWDGAVFLGNDSFSTLVQRCIETPHEPQSCVLLGAWLRQFREGYEYDRVFLSDPDGVEVASAPATPEPITPFVASAVVESLRTRAVTFLDFHREGPGALIHLSVLVPIYAQQQNHRPLGVLALRIDPDVQLYPIIRRWPTPSRTAETLLVRRDGDDVLFLNELRFRKDAALSLREPLSDERLPAAKAVLGHRGNVEGVDYRGVAVIGAVGPVPDSPWFLVARMDAAEAYAPLTERVWLMVLVVAALLFGSGATLGLVWRQHTVGLYREKYEAARALHTSQTELRQRNEELTRFTYAVSHDLKSPLVTIQTFVGYLQQDLAKQDAAGVEKDFGFIRGAAQKMARLLDELLELSRVGRRENPPEDVPLQAAVEEALALVAGRIAERGARVEVTKEPIILRGDRVRLVEIFQNLTDNAVKFMGEQASPLVEVGAQTSGGETVLFVRDNGAGVDPRHKTKLFGLFEKLDPQSEGTGIGLALVRRIVEGHGGRIWVESEGPGHGACFRFTLAGTRRVPEEDIA